MAEKRSQEIDDGFAHSGRVENATQENKDGDGQKDDAGHAFIHPSDHDEGRDLSGKSQIAQGTDAEAEGDGYPGDKAGRYEDNQEQKDLGAPQLHKRGREEPEYTGDRYDQKSRDREVAP